MKKIINKLPVSGFITDAVIILTVYFSYEINKWIHHNLLYVFWLSGTLQALSIYSVLRKQNNVSGNDITDTIIDKLSVFYHLMLILAVGGFLWLFLPALIIDTPAAWGVFIFNFFVSIIGSLLAYGFSEKRKDLELTKSEKAVGFLAPLMYLITSETIISTAASTESIGPYVALFCVMLSYLPIRFLMLLSPPKNKWELVTAAIAFAYFTFSLFFRIKP